MLIVQLSDDHFNYLADGALDELCIELELLGLVLLLDYLREQKAIESRSERLALYKLIGSALRSEAGSAVPGH